LCKLADFVETTPFWNEVAAFRAETALSSRLGFKQLGRVGDRYGFEQVSEPPSWGQHLHDIGGCFHGWGLTRVHNPNALSRQRFFRPYDHLWMTRSTLIDRYGRGQRGRDQLPAFRIGVG
jgi:hypothetical protein